MMQTYDDDAHVVSETQSQVWDAAAGANMIWDAVHTYTSFGSPLRQVTGMDSNGDGVVDARYVVDYQYGANGESPGYSNSGSRAPDWAPSVSSSAQITNTLIADGVLALAQQYFEFMYSDYTSVAF